MRRSAGLIFAQIALAANAFFQLCFMLGSAAAAFTLPRVEMPTPPPHGLLTGVMIAASLFFAALATLSILTIVGLVRRRSWARYSILIQGGLFAVFGALFTLGTLATRAMVPRIAQQPGQTPQSMALASTVFLVIAALYALITAVGVWVLVYFNLRSTRALFEPAPTVDPSLPPPPPGRFDHIPTPILVLVGLYALSAVFSAVAACLHFPAFLMGFLVTGAAMHLLYLTLAILAAVIGYGLFRLDNRARIAGLVQAAVAFVNIGLSVLPYYRAHLQEYSAQINAEMHMPTSTTAPNLASSYPFTIVTGVLGIAVVGVFVWVLIRYRPAFRPSD